MYKIEWATSIGISAKLQTEEYEDFEKAVFRLRYLYAEFTGWPTHDCFLAYLVVWHDGHLVSRYVSDWYKSKFESKTEEQKKLEAFDKIAAIFKEF